ncbi:alanine racemase [Alicyclobacillus curvatus]|nr:alanine racemase [Alicyclobacillus curvatus]
MFRGTFAVVNLQAITSNVRTIKGLLGSVTKLLVAVKADGYGHGAVEAASAALAGGADALGVASLEEGLQLRKAGIEVPVLVFGRVSASGLPIAAEHNISVTLTSDWRDEAIATCTKPLHVHLKLDTGMSRLGYTDVLEAVEIAKWVLSRQDMNLAGVYSHLACADAPDDTHLKGQARKFEEALRILEEHHVRPRLAHLANSAGTLRSPKLHYDMVRVGVSAYGYAPDAEFPLSVHLQPALSLYARIQRLTVIGVGETVGYGATFTANRPTRVATIPIGYADGYFRVFSNQSEVWVNGFYAPVIGNVCMDQLMIDVTDVPHVKPLDWVTVYGQAVPQMWNQVDFSSKPDAERNEFVLKTFSETATGSPVVSLDRLAKQAGTISYELMCAVSTRIPKIYFRG